MDISDFVFHFLITTTVGTSSEVGHPLRIISIIC